MLYLNSRLEIQYLEHEGRHAGKGECIDGMTLPILSLTISLALCGDLYAEMEC